METRQLAAFCAVVERGSFSGAAQRLGVSQPAVSQQVKGLEERFGQRLLERSGRRVEATEAGLRLYRSARRVLDAEEQLLSDVTTAGEDEVSGKLAIGASTGPGGRLVPLLLCELARAHPRIEIALSISDTHTVIERVAARDLELGVVGAARRVRGLAFDPFVRDEIVLAVPAGHPLAGRTVELADLDGETLIEMQEGAGVRQVVEDELRRRGARIRPRARIELGLQESAKSAVVSGFGVSFISENGLEGELSAGTVGIARVEGIQPIRQIYLVRSATRALTRAAEAFIGLAGERASGM
jgi:DNA-binding transcriptional LysR family regulator